MMDLLGILLVVCALAGLAVAGVYRVRVAWLPMLGALLGVLSLSSCAVVSTGDTRVASLGGKTEVHTPAVVVVTDHEQSFADGAKVAGRLITWNGIASVAGSIAGWAKAMNAEDGETARDAIAANAATDQATTAAESSVELSEINAGLARMAEENRSAEALAELAADGAE